MPSDRDRSRKDDRLQDESARSRSSRHSEDQQTDVSAASLAKSQTVKQREAREASHKMAAPSQENGANSQPSTSSDPPPLERRVEQLFTMMEVVIHKISDIEKSSQTGRVLGNSDVVVSTDHDSHEMSGTSEGEMDDDDDPLARLESIFDQENRPSTSALDEHFDRLISDLSDLFATDETKGPEITAGLANIVHNSLRRKPNDDHVKKLMELYKAPSNVANLMVPRTNADVWEALNRGPKFVDVSLQKTQALLGKALVPILQFLHGVGTKSITTVEDQLRPMNDALRLLTAAFNYLHQARREVVKNDIREPVMSKLCSWEVPVGTDLLFDCDVTKKVEELKKSKKLGAYSTHKRSFGRKSSGPGKWNQKRHGNSGRPYPSGNYNRSKKPFLGQQRKGKDKSQA